MKREEGGVLIKLEKPRFVPLRLSPDRPCDSDDRHKIGKIPNWTGAFNLASCRGPAYGRAGVGPALY